MIDECAYSCLIFRVQRVYSLRMITPATVTFCSLRFHLHRCHSWSRLLISQCLRCGDLRLWSNVPISSILPPMFPDMSSKRSCICFSRLCTKLFRSLVLGSSLNDLSAIFKLIISLEDELLFLPPSVQRRSVCATAADWLWAFPLWRLYHSVAYRWKGCLPRLPNNQRCIYCPSLPQEPSPDQYQVSWKRIRSLHSTQQEIWR